MADTLDVEEVARNGVAVNSYATDESDDAIEPRQAPPQPADRYAYWDEATKAAKQRQRGVITSMAGPEDVYTTDWGQIAENLVVIAWELIKLVFKLVTWPLRWGWKKSRGTTLS